MFLEVKKYVISIFNHTYFFKGIDVVPFVDWLKAVDDTFFKRDLWSKDVSEDRHRLS